MIVSKGGFHRAGTLAACLLCAFGLTPEMSIRLVKDARGTSAIGRDHREAVVTKFDQAWTYMGEI